MVSDEVEGLVTSAIMAQCCLPVSTAPPGREKSGRVVTAPPTGVVTGVTALVPQKAEEEEKEGTPNAKKE